MKSVFSTQELLWSSVVIFAVISGLSEKHFQGLRITFFKSLFKSHEKSEKHFSGLKNTFFKFCLNRVKSREKFQKLNGSVNCPFVFIQSTNTVIDIPNS